MRRILIVSLLVMAMTLTACGSSETRTDQSSQAKNTVIPDALVGNWVCLGDGRFLDRDGSRITEFRIGENGDFTINGTTYQGEYTYSGPGSHGGLFVDGTHYQLILDDNGTILDGEILTGGLLLVGEGITIESADTEGANRFYKEGSEEYRHYKKIIEEQEAAAEAERSQYDGKWIWVEDQSKIPIDIPSFEIYDGRIILNGASYELERESGIWTTADANYTIRTFGAASYAFTYSGLTLILDDDCEANYISEVNMQKYLVDTMAKYEGDWISSIADPKKHSVEFPYRHLEIKGTQVILDGRAYDAAFRIGKGGYALPFYVVTETNEISFSVNSTGFFADILDESYMLIRESEAPTAVELTVENWQDYLHPIIVYDVSRNSWKEAEYVNYHILLVPNDSIEVVALIDGRVAVDIEEPSVYTILTYDDKKDEIVGTRPMTDDEYEEYKHLFEGVTFPISNEADFKKSNSSLTVNAYKFTSPVLPFAHIVYFSENEFTKDGDIIICPVISDFKITVTRIMGTLYYYS